MEIRKDRTTRSAKADESNETGFYFFPLPVRLQERLLVHGGIAGWVEKGYPLTTVKAMDAAYLIENKSLTI